MTNVFPFSSFRTIAMQQDAFTTGLLDFLARAVTPYHAVAAMVAMLEAQGFQGLDEADAWHLPPRGYVVRGGGLIAFRLGDRPGRDGLRMVGAHTDSPCLKLKPDPLLEGGGLARLGVEVYGGALLNPWFDRDLTLSGLVCWQLDKGPVRTSLVDFKRPMAVLPSLAIHLDPEANKERTINKHQHLPPIISLAGETPVDLKAVIAARLAQEHPETHGCQVLDFDLLVRDCQGPSLVGLNGEFICAARLDNLLSCHVGLRALLDAEGDQDCLLVCNDHEEVGSTSSSGAQGPFLRSLLGRLFGHEDLERCLRRSLLVSADNAHAIHPNHADRMDERHAPRLNGGPVIKRNAGQRYATDAVTAALFRRLCAEAGAPVQDFVMRTDLACGSTIGPLTAAEIGVATVDVGVPTLAMHSIRETAGSRDAWLLYQVLAHFFSRPGRVYPGDNLG